MGSVHSWLPILTLKNVFGVGSELSFKQTPACLFQHFLDLQLVGEHQYSASLLHAHDTSTRATMNVAVGDGVIAAGQDGTCCVMKTHFSKQREGSKAAAEDGERCCSSLA